MKILKIIVSFSLFLLILFLLVWAGIKTNHQTCTDISVIIHAPKNSQLLSKSDVLHLLKQNNKEWQGKTIVEIEPAAIHKILAQENYIKSVDKIHFLGAKLQIEVTLHDILLEIIPTKGEKFLIDVDGIYLPYSPKTGNDIITVTGNIPHNFQKKKTITPENKELYEIFKLASLLKTDPFYAALFHKIVLNEKQELVLHPTVGNLPVLFGNMQDAENKLMILKYMYHDVLPYMSENKYAQLDVRFKNRIVATKTKS